MSYHDPAMLAEGILIMLDEFWPQNELPASGIETIVMNFWIVPISDKELYFVIFSIICTRTMGVCYFYLMRFAHNSFSDE